MSYTTARARVAGLSRSRTADDPDFLNARREFAEEKLALHIERVIANAPPLTEAQCDRLAAILSRGAA